MNVKEKNATKLYDMLMTYESDIVKGKHTTIVSNIRNGGIIEKEFNNPKGKVSATSKIPRLINPEDAICTYCGIKEHWRHNCQMHRKDPRNTFVAEPSGSTDK